MKKLTLNDFDYELPQTFIAQTPIENRSESKLMIVDKLNGNITHEKFYNIINYLNKNDVLVLNNTKVLPIRLNGIKEETNAKIEVFLLENVVGTIWECLTKPQKRVKEGTIISFSDSFKCKCIKVLEDGICHFEFIYDGIFNELLDKYGTVPLPPYIHNKLKDNNRYNTVYALKEGSSAAPTAGLHFTKELLNKLKEKGVDILYVTLNIGLGTFRPVVEQDIENHKIHSEKYCINEETARKLNHYKDIGKRIICVGTTSLRTLEANYSKYNKFVPTVENASIFIYPPYKIKSCDALITNFHLPKSTLLMLVSAFSSMDIIKNAYESAKANDYKFFSFGDAMLLINNKRVAKTSYYDKIINEYNNDNNKDFTIIKGNNNIILSAPHAYKHFRNNREKSREYNTDNIVKILHNNTSCHIIYTNNNINEDPNYDSETEYKAQLTKYIKENNIKYLLDIHGMDNKAMIELGTSNGYNIDGDILDNIKRILKANVTNNILIDNKFKAGASTISNNIKKSCDINALQIELDKKYRRKNGLPRKFNSCIIALSKVIEYLERN